MPKSLVRGDYSLLLAIESSSSPNSWYRVLADRQTGLLSCDCPPWTFNRNRDAQGHRSCLHTHIGDRLSQETHQARETDTRPMVSSTHPLVRAAQEQWPGLSGVWSIERTTASIGTKSYSFLLLRLDMGNGGTATGTVAHVEWHHHSEQEMIAGVAGWAGYAIAAEVARLGGFPLAGQVPEYFRVDRSRSSQRGQYAQTPASPPAIGLVDLLRVGDIVDLGDGLRPAERAERTLELFMGTECYTQLNRQGFLDISSVRYADRQRVYRLRRDPRHLRERRLRVFEQGRYVYDFCIVRGQDVPEADWYLTCFLQLLSDEQAALAVVQRYNVFSPYSDGNERESIPAVWQPRAG